MQTSARVYLDLDGVLADFNRGVAEVFDLPYPESGLLGYGWMYYMHLWERMSVEEYLDRLAKEKDFWANLLPFPWYRDIPNWLDWKQLDWAFLSSTTNHWKSYSGKVQWVQTNYGKDYLPKLILLLENKSRIARPGDILVDDSEKNCQEWVRAGGLAFHWQEYAAGNPQVIGQIRRLQEFILHEHKNVTRAAGTEKKHGTRQRLIAA